MFKKKKSPEQVKFEAVINDGFDAVCENRFIEWREAHKEEFEEALKHERFWIAEDRTRRRNFWKKVVVRATTATLAAILITLINLLLSPR